MKKKALIAAAALIAAPLAVVPQAHAEHALEDPAVMHNGIEEHSVDVAISPLGETARCLNFHGVDYSCWQYLPGTGERVDLHESIGTIKVFPFWKYPTQTIEMIREGGVTEVSVLLAKAVERYTSLSSYDLNDLGYQLQMSSEDLSSGN